MIERKATQFEISAEWPRPLSQDSVIERSRNHAKGGSKKRIFISCFWEPPLAAASLLNSDCLPQSEFQARLYHLQAISRNLQLRSLSIFQANDHTAAKPGAHFDIVKQ